MKERIIITMAELEDILKKEKKRQFIIGEKVKKEIRKIFSQKT